MNHNHHSITVMEIISDGDGDVIVDDDKDCDHDGNGDDNGDDDGDRYD